MVVVVGVALSRFWLLPSRSVSWIFPGGRPPVFGFIYLAVRLQICSERLGRIGIICHVIHLSTSRSSSIVWIMCVSIDQITSTVSPQRQFLDFM